MLDKLTERQAEALHRMASNPDFQVLREWLESSIQSIRVQNDDVADTDSFRRNQGAIAALKKVLEDQDQSGEILRKFRNR